MDQVMFQFSFSPTLSLLLLVLIILGVVQLFSLADSLAARKKSDTLEQHIAHLQYTTQHTQEQQRRQKEAYIQQMLNYSANQQNHTEQTDEPRVRTRKRKGENG